MTKVDGDTDWFLRSLVDIVNQTTLSFGITLNVRGLIISGLLISGREFFTNLNEEWIDGWRHAPALAESFESIFKRIANIYPLIEDEDSEANKPDEEEFFTTYIHLRDAKIFQPGSAPLPTNRGIQWRGRLESVDGFSLGMLSSE